MAQGRPSRGESAIENLQDYVEESIQNSTDLPDTGAVRDQEQMPAATPGQQLDQPASGGTNISAGTAAALDEHLAATENVRGAGQSADGNAGTADIASTNAQQEARTRITDSANDELGMGSVRR